MWPFDMFGNKEKKFRTALDDFYIRYHKIMQEQNAAKASAFRVAQIRKRMGAIKEGISRIEKIEDKKRSIEEWERLHREEEEAIHRLVEHIHHAEYQGRKQAKDGKGMKRAA